MNRVIILAIISLISFKSYSQDTKYHKVEIQTSAICEMCQYAIEKEMALEKGVQSSNLDLETKILTVTYHTKKTNVDKIKQRISLTGYHAGNVKRDSAAYKKLPFCCQDGAHGSNSHQEPKE